MLLFLSIRTGLIFVVLCTGFLLPVQGAPGLSLESYLERLGYASIPLKRGDDNHLLASAEINGKKSVLLVDSGWSLSTLDRRVAKRVKTLGDLGLTLEDSFLGRITNRSLGLVEHLKLGNAEFFNQPVQVSEIKIGGKRTEEDGALGCDFLFRNFCLLGCKQRQLYVRSSAVDPKISEAMKGTLQRAGFREVPLHRTEGLVFTCEAVLQGQPLKLIVDTGAVWSMLDERIQRRISLYVQKVPAEIKGVGKRGTHALQKAEVKNLVVGGTVTLANVVFGVAPLDAWGVGRDDHAFLKDVDGFLGAEQLVFNEALIDFHGATLWLRPSGK